MNMTIIFMNTINYECLGLEQHEVPIKPPYDWYIDIRDTKPALTRGGV